MHSLDLTGPAGTGLVVQSCVCSGPTYRICPRPNGMSVWRCTICRDEIPCVLGHYLDTERKDTSPYNQARDYDKAAWAPYEKKKRLA